jgi:hypothetical protein
MTVYDLFMTSLQTCASAVGLKFQKGSCNGDGAECEEGGVHVMHSDVVLTEGLSTRSSLSPWQDAVVFLQRSALVFDLRPPGTRH